MKTKKISIIFILLALLMLPCLSSSAKTSTRSEGGWMYGYLWATADCSGGSRQRIKYVSQVFRYCDREFYLNLGKNSIAENCKAEISKEASSDCSGAYELGSVAGYGDPTQEDVTKHREREFKPTNGGRTVKSSHLSCVESLYSNKCK